jgi:citrate lyase beta subunit
MSYSVLHPTLYTPATTVIDKQLGLVNAGVPGVWRVVLCTEDSIHEEDIPDALQALRIVLAGMASSNVTVFVRVRNPEVMAQVLDLPYVEKLSGFVIPKADPHSFPSYADQVVGTNFRLMPILESPLMMDRHFRETLRMVLVSPRYHGMIDCVRIGANDLMGHLGIRRDDDMFTVYDTPVGITIHEIINEFRGLAGFTVTAPVFECFAPEYDLLLHTEVRHHIMNGLFGQTVIHPRHIRIIRDLYKVSERDLESARRIVHDPTAVSGLNGKMDERATHLKWAELVLERYRLFGDSKTSQTLMAEVR